MFQKLYYFILFAVTLLSPALQAQVQRNLSFYLEQAASSSPLLHDLYNQTQLSLEEQERLKAQYTRSRLEMDGNYLFVPIINHDNGKTSFQWDAGDASDYYGYDSGVTSGEFRAGFTWTKPLTGGAPYRMARQKGEIERDRLNQQIKMELHELNRAVTEQYLLCQSDLIGLTQSDSIHHILTAQRNIVEKLTRQALAKPTDLHLIDIEIGNNQQVTASFRQSYWSHLLELNLMCGIRDTAEVQLEPVHLSEQPSLLQSSFLKPYFYDSLSINNEYRQFEMQYRPRLNLFVDGGVRTVSRFTNLPKHFGASVGLTLSWLLSDGGQKKSRLRTMQFQMNTNEAYKTQRQIMVAQKRNACRKQLDEQTTKLNAMRNQLTDYENLLQKYQREIAAGELSVLNYITVLKSYVQQKKDYDSQRINRELMVNALNYWNW